VWVRYAPVGEDGSPTGIIDTVPWEGIVLDNAGQVLKAYVDLMVLSTRNRLVKKACEMVNHCLANESLCAELVAEHDEKYPREMT
jgi:hypothetical protein